MSCPYTDCTRERLGASLDRCPQCERPVRPCESCGSYNRPFANHCRICGERVNARPGDWTGFRGGAQRISLNRPQGLGKFRTIAAEPEVELTLDSACRGLLLVDHHLLAVSETGAVKVLDLARRERIGEWTFEGPLHGKPAVGRGTLYVGAESGLLAFTLGKLTQKAPAMEPRWRLDLPGTLTGPLLPWEEHLYATVALEDHRHAIVLVANAAGSMPAKPRVLAEGGRFSALAGHPAPVDQIYCLSEEKGRLMLTELAGASHSEPVVQQRPLRNAPLPLQEHRPVAAIGKRIFAILEDEDTFCMLDGSRSRFGRRFRKDVRDYALSTPQSGVLVHGGGLFALANNQDEKHDYLRNVRCPPVLVENFAVFFGLPNGVVRYHRLDNLPVFEDLRLTQKKSSEVTALASADDRLAAGDAQGSVQLWRFEATT